MLGPAELLVLVILLVAVASWIWAELKAGLAARLTSGTVVACSLACLAYYIGWLGPQYTIHFYDTAIKRSAVALDHGQLEVVRQAFADYTSQSKPNPIPILARIEKAVADK